MQNPIDDNMPDPLDFIPGQKTVTITNDTNNVHSATLPQSVPKKGKIVVNVLTTILLVPVIIAGYIIATVIGLWASHENELSKLEKETVSIFRTSNFAPSTYDCHDVELRNECYFILSGSNADVQSLLLNQGFSKDNTYRNGFKKDGLYIDDNGDSSYSSFYVK